MNQRIKIIQQDIQELTKLNNYLCNLFPKNYFLSQQKKDDFIFVGWDSIPFNELGKYDNGNDLWIDDNNKEWAKAFHGTGRNCKYEYEYEIKDMINSILQNGFKMVSTIFMLLVKIYIILKIELEIEFMSLLI